MTARIQRANLDGTDIETLIMGGALKPNGVALDSVKDRMYRTGGSTIRRADLDGTNVAELITGGLMDTQGIALTLSPRSPIPTISEWGVLVMTLLVLTGGAYVFREERPAA